MVAVTGPFHGRLLLLAGGGPKFTYTWPVCNFIQMAETEKVSSSVVPRQGRAIASQCPLGHRHVCAMVLKEDGQICGNPTHSFHNHSEGKCGEAMRRGGR